MKVHLILASFIFFGTISCSRDMQNNAQFARSFNNKLMVLEIFVDTRDVGVDCFLESLFYIECVTEIKGNPNLGDITTYDKDVFASDKKNWQDWFNKIGYQLTLAEADSIFVVNQFKINFH